MKKEDFKRFFRDPISLRYDLRVCLEEEFRKHLRPGSSIYDIGCGDKPFEAFLEGQGHNYVGVDIEDGFYDASHIDLVGDAYNVPVENGKADAVISCELIEHLERPMDSILENNRILKQGGTLFLAFPFLYPIHAAPRDFQRFSEYCIQNMMKQSGFEIVNFKRIGGFWYSMGIFSGIYLIGLNKGITRKLGIFQALNFTSKFIFLLMHKLEGLIFTIAGKNPENFRLIWPCNYVFVAKKISEPPKVQN